MLTFFREAHDITLTDAAAAKIKKSAVILDINTTTGLAMMVEHIVHAHSRDPQRIDIFVDTEGNCVSGALSLVQIFVESIDTAYIIDTLALGMEAFTTTAISSNTTLKDIFESSSIKKAIYGIIGDSHELWKSYGVHVAGFEDMHLLAIALYGCKAKSIGKPLTWCVESLTKGEISNTQRDEWLERKKWAKGVFKDTEQKQERLISGEEVSVGWTPTFNIRPILQEVRDYSAADVTILRGIYRHLLAKLPTIKDRDLWIARVAAKTHEHIAASQTPGFNPNEKRAWGVPEWEGLPW